MIIEVGRDNSNPIACCQHYCLGVVLNMGAHGYWGRGSNWNNEGILVFEPHEWPGPEIKPGEKKRFKLVEETE